ncbi:DNA polymerase/3'-5' exonuclease PolX [Thioalbus denitrificans]|uniref:DNA polymerase beta n=1 Tax=Thioalbus denitrificans TaxID=547122 RepID=A0A369BU14_9GAMM|nr:DNA polymerase/3'-5' exonuclease PolX [Thioalbus denitrificans]RCX24871.1 DNA polymerase (family 10) [Thioalbus denitrificans]
MPTHNADIAAALNEIADLLEIEAANPFRVRAYRNAARTVENLSREVGEMLAAGADLTELPGIGKDLAAKLRELVETGRLRALQKLKREVPESLGELLHLPGLGPKRVHALYHELEIETPKQLYRAARDGRLRELHGFGEKTEQKLLAALEARLGTTRRFRHAVAAQYAEPLRDYLAKVRGVERAVIAGSYRRCRDTVGDIDILVTATNPEAVMERFSAYDEVVQVQSRGSTRATVTLRSGLQVDLRVMAAESFGAALHYFTGSKAHNIAVRRRAQSRGLKLNEYGVFRGGKRVAGGTEESVFAAVGLPWIAPELRENQGEIEAAEAGRLPELVTLEALRGDLHAHTTATDGHASLEEMAAAARERGLEYLAITEHSRRLTMAHGLDPKRLREQGRAIDRLNGRLRGITLLKGIEVDILEDGSLDLPDEVLGELDLVVAAIHGKFDLSRERQTRRILTALANPNVHILAHPGGRLIGEREPYDVDMPRIIRAAKRHGCFLELNAHPERLDLLDTHCRLAKEEGVKVAISSDAHSVQDFDHLRDGIGQARRGWLEPGDVLNTRSLTALRKLLQRRQ